MALTGQLSDMSLAELIEFFCNQRKTGRLKIDYPRGHSVFFIKDGELVDARVGALSGAEAVYFSLTLPNAAFDFSPEVLPTRQTISEKWTQVVLEGLRRLDEGLAPTEADAFDNPSESDVAQFMDQVERLGEGAAARPAPSGAEPSGGAAGRLEPKDAPPSMTVGGAGGKKKWMVAGTLAAVVLGCAVAAIPLGLFSGDKPADRLAAPAVAAPSESTPPRPAAGEQSAGESPAEAPAVAAEVSDASAGANAAALAARREREERERRDRERRERERRAAEEQARRDEQAQQPADAAPAAAPAPAPAGPKSVRVSVAYDEAGRVVQASVAGATPGAEAYGATAVRLARGRRFPAGKAGATVVTIPFN